MIIERLAQSIILNKYSWLIIACLIAAALRIWLPWESIFTGGHVNFVGNDSYYQMNVIRQVYEGIPVPGVNTYYAQGIISIAWLFTFGKLTWPVIENIAVFIPVILSVGTVLIVYFIGRLLQSHFTGCLAAFIVAILPGEYFVRSCLGAVDYHALEVFLTSGIILCLIIWSKNELKFNIKNWVALGLAFFLAYAYMVLWQGAAGFLPVLAAFIFIPLYRYFKQNKVIKSLITTFVTIFIIASAYFIFNKAMGISSLITSWTAEAQPGFYDYVVTLHIFLAIFFSFVYFRQHGELRLPMIIWTALMAIAAAWQRRFDYYLIVPLSILIGFSVEKFFNNINGWDQEPVTIKRDIPVLKKGEI